MARPSTLTRDVSPPPLRKFSTINTAPPEEDNTEPRDPTLAAIEAGQVEIRDHLDYFVQKLSAVSRSCSTPRMNFESFQDLYKRNQHSKGRHFVIHQHDHPISGVHYDLRLQFSESSAVSFAIPYGLPGNPNSSRPNRMAIETRVHNLWNNIIESASHATGSLLIWDIGEYEVLPRAEKQQKMTDDEASEDEDTLASNADAQSERLCSAFRSRHIKLRLCGRKLPENYVVSLRLSSANDRSAQPRKPKHKRRRTDPARNAAKSNAPTSDNESDTASTLEPADGETVIEEEDLAVAQASEGEEDTTIRANNAYTGSLNTIGSVHQRHWFLTLDRTASGFRKSRRGSDAGRWIGEWEPFYVMGRDHEASVITGRTADEVMADEGVEKFVGRKMWRAIVE
ncbi:hypothetical protein M409DRAFT_19767 [Zasmidium cellare ATCC 36951]|uniref:DNA ligase D 3'-phosphoesterase domain-containing protein n=1 Tax=Zasmidium cellare ATCC 36951 TaxID=1080233 RepID=A0A6A6CSU2_ZASCE|nr:uncharacterized protein M409DRAFT_19767 [Zasmidium cellare ATCC 36951]KAF2170161.1 hypothetical protein M409DRAFT_19767 [Zasmidium cellare ATCC 36951]